LALGWPYPERIVDLYCEFRVETNGTMPAHGNSLIGALLHYGLPAMGAEDKAAMRDLILRGGQWDGSERAAILAYCGEDVLAVARLMPAMLPAITSSSQRLGWALLRGCYMAAVARMEWNGVPIDVPTLECLTEFWPDIADRLIEEVDRDFNVYDGRSFRSERFAQYLTRNGHCLPGASVWRK